MLVPQPKRIFISTGEVSGDLQASYLARELLAQRPELKLYGVGGQRMAELGIPLVGDTTTIGSIGVFEALPFIVPTLKIQSKLWPYLRRNRPDLVVLVDYIGVNVPLGRLARRLGIPVVYYIAPQEWVWRTFRNDTARIVAFAELILAVFPEEARYFERNGGKVQWIGHPLTDIVRSSESRAAFRARMDVAEHTPVVVLAPASRVQEIEHLMPTLFETARSIQTVMPQVRFWIVLSTERFREPLENAARKYGLNFQFVPEGDNYNALAAADLLITKSGTINLEAALLELPQVVAYRVNPKTFWIAKNLTNFKIPYMSPVNLVDMSPVVPEFLQEQATVEVLTRTSLELLTDPGARARMQAGYSHMRENLGTSGAIARGASAILNVLDKYS